MGRDAFKAAMPEHDPREVAREAFDAYERTLDIADRIYSSQFEADGMDSLYHWDERRFWVTKKEI